MKSSKSQSNKSGKSGASRRHEQSGSGRQQQAASGAGGQYGEGNYEATRQYNEGLKRHLETSDTEQEARDAAPKTASEESDLLQAEREGRSKARGGTDDDIENPKE